jgi:hypothetical protein
MCLRHPPMLDGPPGRDAPYSHAKSMANHPFRTRIAVVSPGRLSWVRHVNAVSVELSAESQTVRRFTVRSMIVFRR